MKLTTFILCRQGQLFHRIYDDCPTLRRHEAERLKKLRRGMRGYAANYEIGLAMSLKTRWPVETVMEYFNRECQSEKLVFVANKVERLRELSRIFTAAAKDSRKRSQVFSEAST